MSALTPHPALATGPAPGLVAVGGWRDWRTWLIVASAFAIIVGCGPGIGLVRSALGVGALGLLASWRRLGPLPGLPWLCLLVIWMSISAAVTGIEDGEFKPPSRNLILLPLAVYLGMAAWSLPGVGRWLDRCLAVALAAGLALMAVQLAVGWKRDGGGRWHVDAASPVWTKASGFFYSHIEAGLFFALAIVLAWSHRGAALPAPLRWALRLLSVPAVVFTTSRGCAVGALAGMLVMPAAWRRGARALAWALSVAVFGLYLLQLNLARPAVFERSLHMEDGRHALWKVEVDLIRKRPWFGCGGAARFTALSRAQFAESCPGEVAEFPAGIPEPHSAYLGWPVYYGIPALVLWLGWLGTVVAWGFRQRQRVARRDAWLAAAFCAAFLVAGVGDMLPQSVMLASLVYLLIGSALAGGGLARPPEARAQG